MNIKARLKNLEKRKQASGERTLWINGVLGRPLNLANSTCRRTLNADGSLTVVVDLDGSDEDLTREELERFIERFPIQRAKNHRAQ